MQLAFVGGSVGGGLPSRYTHPMKPADNRPAQIRQEVAERVARAQREDRRSLHKLMALTLALGIMIGLALGILVAERWIGGQEVIFIPANGVDV